MSNAHDRIRRPAAVLLLAWLTFAPGMPAVAKQPPTTPTTPTPTAAPDQAAPAGAAPDQSAPAGAAAGQPAPPPLPTEAPSPAPATPPAGTPPDQAAPVGAAPSQPAPTGAAPDRSAPAAAGAKAPPPVPIPVDVWALNPDVQELHLDIRDNVVNMTVDQAVQIALQRNLPLVLQRYIRNEARLGIEQALGIYDLNLTGLLAYTSSTFAPGQGPTVPTNENTQEAKIGFTQLVPTGGTVGVSWDNLRENLVANATFFPFPTSYEPTVGVTLTQPLLRGFGIEVTDEPILLAQNTSEVNRTQFEIQVITTTVQVVDQYWQLVNAREQLVVAQESLQLARDLNERNRIQVAVGTLAPLEIVQSEAAIATREQDIITAQQAIGDAADALRLSLNLPQGDLWHLDILPTTPPETPAIDINLQESIDTALASRPEVHTEQLNVDRAKIVDRVAKNSLLPQLNLVGGYNLTGLEPSFSAALGQISATQIPGWNIQLQLTYPIQNRAARAAKAIADLDVSRYNSELDQEKRTVLMEVRKAVRGIETAEKVIVAAHASRRFQEKNLDAEKKRYENGMSTSFLVTQIQDQLTQAKQAEVNAVVGYRTALAEYYRSIGKLVPEMGIQIVDPKTPVNRFTFRREKLLP